jgi:putative ABC transport system ATP-binding protein
LIETISLTKTYQVGNQEINALRQISLTIGPGEFVAIMGPSGSGKSTLMTLLGCLDRPSSGKLLLDGEDISKFNEKALSRIRNQKIGFVFQSFNLLNDMNAVENVSLPLFYSRLPKPQRLKKTIAALEKVGLGNRLNHKPLELSGGQQQRVSVARALVNDPVLLLADEPTGALDTKTSYEIMHLFKELNDLGATIVIITHEPDIARCTKRIIWLRDGEIIKDIANQPNLEYLVDNRRATGDLV